jgi:hypothetical protein
LAKHSSNAGMLPPGTEWRDIFWLPGESDVTSQVALESSKETKMALSSVRIAAGVGISSAVIAQLSSEWLFANSTLLLRRPLSTPHGICIGFLPDVGHGTVPVSPAAQPMPAPPLAPLPS